MDERTSAPDPAVLHFFTPFQTLDESQLIVLASRTELVRVGEGARIHSIGDTPPGWHFLLQGVVEFEADDGTRRVVESGSDRARDAIDTERPCPHHATAIDAVMLIRVDPSLLDALHESGQETADDDRDAHPILKEIRQELRSNRFSLPSLPEVALRIRKVIEGETANVARVTRVVSADPVITAKLIKAANSAFFHGSGPIETCHAAIVRLGMNTTKQLVISFALRDLFRLKDPAFKKRMQQTWRHSTEIGALCMLLAQASGRLEPEQALLAGLVHDIGAVALLSHAQKHPGLAADDKALSALVRALRGEVGGLVLKHWNFSEAMAQAAIHAYDWRHDSGGEVDYCDLVIIAQLHSLMKSGKVSRHPPIEEIPAYRKLSPDVLTPQNSLKILDQAADQVGEIIRMLS